MKKKHVKKNESIIELGLSKKFTTEETCYNYFCNNCNNETYSKYKHDSIKCDVCYDYAYYSDYETETNEEEFYYCPVCEAFSVNPSEHLSTVMSGKKLYFANLITHYRHRHRHSWDRMWK